MTRVLSGGQVSPTSTESAALVLSTPKNIYFHSLLLECEYKAVLFKKICNQVLSCLYCSQKNADKSLRRLYSNQTFLRL